MKDFSAQAVNVETLSALDTVNQASVSSSYPAYIGLDVHKESIVISVARAGRDAPEPRGEIANKPKKIKKLVEQLNQEFDGEVLLFCYEAGPCGYGLYRQLLELGHDCHVVAPSLVPKKSGERVKNDKRDANKLAKHLRGGDLTAVWVPDHPATRERPAPRCSEVQSVTNPRISA